MVIVFVIGAGLRIRNLDNVLWRSSDEGIYTRQANVIIKQGAEGIRSMVKEHDAKKKLWIFPPPTRIGYLGLLAGVMKAINRSDDKTGAYISSFFSICALLLLVLMGLRFFNPLSTLFALLFLSVSPMDLAISRRTWSDAMFGFIGLAMVYFCCEITRNTNRVIWYVLLIVIGSYCLLVKELGMVVYGLCLAWVLWITWVKERSFPKGALFLAFSLAGASVSLLVLTHTVGGITPVIRVIEHIRAGLLTNSYAIRYQTGAWYRFLQGFWVISPLNSFLFLVGLIVTLLPDKGIIKDRRPILGVMAFAIIFFSFFLAMPYSQNFRYLSAIYAPFYLTGGLGLWYIIFYIKSVARRPSFYIISALITIMIILGAMRDYRIFKQMFVNTGAADVSIRLVI